MTDKTTIAEVYAPGISYEVNARTDSGDIAGVTLQGRLDIEVRTTMPNPNLDAYFDPEYLMEMISRVNINGREWELDATQAELDIDWWIDADDVLESAAIRAAEDSMSTVGVLARWKELPLAPMAVIEAYEVRC